MKAPTEEIWQNSVMSGFMIDFLKQKQMQLHMRQY